MLSNSRSTSSLLNFDFGAAFIAVYYRNGCGLPSWFAPVWLLKTLPPLTRLSGRSPSQEANCLVLRDRPCVAGLASFANPLEWAIGLFDNDLLIA